MIVEAVAHGRVWRRHAGDGDGSMIGGDERRLEVRGEHGVCVGYGTAADADAGEDGVEIGVALGHGGASRGLLEVVHERATLVELLSVNLR